MTQIYGKLAAMLRGSRPGVQSVSIGHYDVIDDLITRKL